MNESAWSSRSRARARQYRAWKEHGVVERRGRLCLDPWPPEYDSAIQFSELDEGVPSAVVDVTVESSEWVPINPVDTDKFKKVCFVDGVRRVEARVLAQREDGIVHGLFGSYAIGCVQIEDDEASFDRQSVGRLLVLGAGLSVTEPVEVGDLSLAFEGRASASNSPDDVLGELQNAMRTAEADLAQKLTRTDTCVFADGPLTYFATSKQEVVGVIKSIYLPYLPASHFSLVSTLTLGSRTPLFSIRDGKYDRYSWFLRVGLGREVEHPLTGIIRLEVRAAIGLDTARRMANFSAICLPKCASTPVRDPRAPQNLLPIGALENELRRRLGDSVLMRRAIEKKLHEGITV